MDKNVCLYVKKKCVRENQLIQGENFFKDGNSGEFDNLDNDYEQIIAMLNSMEFNASKFCY